ncbi:MAG: S8 family serine peptidase [Bacteroidales bacterium]
MKKYKLITLYLLISIFATTKGIAESFYRIEFTDKKENEKLLSDPILFLSERALERRSRYQIEVNEEDLPLSEIYLDSVKASGRIISKSKWNNSCVILSNHNRIEDLRKNDYVKDVIFLGSSKGLKRCGKEFAFKSDTYYHRQKQMDYPRFSRKYYGKAYDQIHFHKGEKLHQSGFSGKGKMIAVIDAGFKGADKLSELNQSRIIGIKDFGYPYEGGYGEEKHGTQVLSVMLSDLSGCFVGTAPGADYLLLRSEALSYELPVEEDFWINAVEYADSCGVDIISSSLGYQNFDQDINIYDQTNLGKNIAISTQIANKASEKGMIVVLSAGNERETSWGGLGFPADAQKAFTVGSVDKKKEISSFSSYGFVTDLSIKPNVVSLGTAPVTIHPNGFYSREDGTSFATPIIAGLIACLWEALPEKSNTEIMELVEGSADLFQSPDSSYGFGIPNLEKAYKTGLNEVDK